MSGPAEVAGTSADTGGGIGPGTGAPGGVGTGGVGPGAAGPGGAPTGVAPAGVAAGGVAAGGVAAGGVAAAGVVGARPVPLLNVANALTVIRLLLVPVFLVVLFAHGGIEPAWRWGAFAVFAIASLTDSFDGDLARRWDQVTDFGKIADPIADKALVGAALVGLSVLGELAWWVTITIAVRELGVTLLRFWVLRHGVIPASRGGKIKTVLQTLALGLAIMPLPAAVTPAVAVLVIAAVVVTVVTGLDYVLRALRLRARARSL